MANKVSSFNKELSPNALLAMTIEQVDNIENIAIAIEWKKESPADTGTNYTGVYSANCPPPTAAMLQKVLDKMYDMTFLYHVS